MLEKRKKNEIAMAEMIKQFKSHRGTTDTLALDIIDYYEEKFSDYNIIPAKEQPALFEDEINARNGKSDNPTVRALGEQINVDFCLHNI